MFVPLALIYSATFIDIMNSLRVGVQLVNVEGHSPRQKSASYRFLLGTLCKVRNRYRAPIRTQVVPTQGNHPGRRAKLLDGTSLVSASAVLQQIIDLWAKWAQVIQEAKPMIDPIEVV